MTHELYTDLPMAEYLRLSAVGSQVIQAMLDECPHAAWYASHLNPLRPADDTDASDRGTIAHKILLEGTENGVAIIDPHDYPAERTGAIPDGWTNKAIRQARDLARAGGLIPVLSSQMESIRAMVSAARTFVAQLRETEPAIFKAFSGGGMAEATIVWDDSGVACKMRPDLLARDYSLIINYKTTATSVNPDRWGRGPFLDYYVGAAWYRRGLRKCFSTESEYVFLTQSVNEPFLCSLIGVDPRWMTLAESQCQWALAKWGECIERGGVWPTYGNRIYYPECPPWLLTKWEDHLASEFRSG